MAKPMKFMPGPKAWPIVGSAMEYSRSGKYTFEKMYIAKKERYEQFGKIHKEQIGPMTLVQLYDPGDFETVFRADGKYPHRMPLPLISTASKRDKVELGLGNCNGEQWYNLRRAVQKPMMHPRAASVYLPAQNTVADDFLKLIDLLKDENNEVDDFYSIIYRYTMESIGTVCFNERLGCLQERIEPGSAAERTISAVQDGFQTVSQTTFAFPWYALWRTPTYKKFLKARTAISEIAYKHIQSAVKTDKCPIAELQKSYSSGDTESNGPNFLLSLVKTEGLGAHDIVGLTTDLFAAGIDSTANGLSFVLYNLAKSAAAQEALLQEIERVMPDGEVTAEALDKMSYMKACVKESFRLHFPVEGGTGRILQKELTLSGYSIPKETVVLMNNQTICTQSEYFDHPEEYRPERWLRSTGTDGAGGATTRAASPFIMLPFGYGSRMCIGRRFAEQEIYLALIKIIKKYRLEYHHEPIEMLNRIFNMPDKPLKIALISR